jgi:GNAT superfamily N-acetyltransferase
VGEDRGSWPDWRKAEYAEQAYMASFGAPEVKDAIAQLGMTISEVGGGVVWATRDDPMGGFLSRAVGQGLREPITADVLDEIVEVATAAGAPTIGIQPSSELETTTLLGVMAERGFGPSRTWDKLCRDVSPPPEAVTDLRVEILGADRAREYADVMLTGFEMPESGRPFVEAETVLPGWTLFGALDGDALAGVAGMYVDGDIACLSGAATLPAYRGRGAQRALLAARITAAAGAGVTFLGTETWSETGDAKNPSLHNMHWAGFRTLYRRRSYVRVLAGQPTDE